MSWLKQCIQLQKRSTSSLILITHTSKVPHSTPTHPSITPALFLWHVPSHKIITESYFKYAQAPSHLHQSRPSPFRLASTHTVVLNLWTYHVWMKLWVKVFTSSHHQYTFYFKNQSHISSSLTPSFRAQTNMISWAYHARIRHRANAINGFITDFIANICKIYSKPYPTLPSSKGFPNFV